MRRKLLHLATAVSLMLMLATVLAWVWLGRYERSIAVVRPNSQIQVGAFPKAVIIERTAVTWSLRPRWDLREGNFYISDGDDVGGETARQVRLHVAGDAAIRTITRTYLNQAGGPPHQALELGIWIPYWLLLVLTLPLPVWVLTVRRRRLARDSRRRRGQCEYCGYDLRASPERCPECGAVATPGSPAAA